MPEQFIRACPDIILDKSLCDTAWLCYCRLEQIAKSSRYVLGFTTRLGFPESATAAALAELSAVHPACFTLDGRKLVLPKSPTKFVKVPFPVIDANLPTWQKRVIVAVLDQVYETAVNRGVGQINLSKLLGHCRVPARSKSDRKRLLRETIDLMVRQGVLEILSQRPGATTACRLTQGATWGATATENEARTPGPAAVAPQAGAGSHPRSEAVAPHPSGQKPKKEAQEKTPKPRNRGEPTQAPAGEELLERRGGGTPMSHTPAPDPDEAPRKPTTWERIESAAPRKSTDSPAELAELWRDRRPAVMALYREAGTDPDPEIIVSDTLQVMANFFNNRLSLGAILGPRWERFHQALGRWLAGAEGRAWQHLPYLVGALGGPPLDLTQVNDETIQNTWGHVTGYAVPCPPVPLIRRLLA